MHDAGSEKTKVGGGPANVCGCTPKTCAQMGKNCGSAPDGCGGTLVCDMPGGCPGGQSCGGAGVPNVCGVGTCTPTSCVALQKTSDYPALIVYNAIYDVYLDGRKIISKMPGVAMARGVMEIPPRNITVAFQKPFAISRQAMAVHKAGGTISVEKHHCDNLPIDPNDPYCIDSGNCEDMATITEEEFSAGLKEAKAIRERMATLRPKPLPPEGKR